MLPTGHIAGGYLTAFLFIKILKPEIDSNQINHLLIVGAFWGFAPDLDVFYAFAKQQNLLVSHPTTPIHRKFFLHAPMFWLIVGLMIFFISASTFGKLFGLILWFSSWSHFFLDSIEYGIMWLWPFNSKVYSLFNQEKKFRIEETNFLKHSFKFLYFYSKSITFYLEIFIIISALIVYFK